MWAEVEVLRAADESAGRRYCVERFVLMDKLVPLIVEREKARAAGRKLRTSAGAEVDYSEDENERGRMQDCVFLTCSRTGEEAGPVWGHGPKSVARGLYRLDDECSCTASRHRDRAASDYDQACREEAL